MIKSNSGAWFLIGLIGVLGLIVYFTANDTNPNVDSDLNNALHDSLKTWKDKDSLNNAQISVIEADRDALLSVIDKKDEELAKLLNNQKIKEVIKIKTVTRFDTTIVADSVSSDCRGVWKLDNGWVKANIGVHKDSLFIKNLTVKNDFTISHEEVDNTSVIHIKSKNPYTSTSGIKDYVVAHPVKKNKWLKNLLIGIGVGVTVGVLVR